MKHHLSSHPADIQIPENVALKPVLVQKHSSSQSVYKKLTLFYVAANALLLAGQILNPLWSWTEFLLLQWCGITGVFTVYRFNDIVDHSANFTVNLRRILSNPVNALCVLQILFITAPAIFFLFSGFRMSLLYATCILGVLYSVKMRIGRKNYRIKHLFLVKNLLIGSLWGGLILIGANSVQDNLVIGLFVFTTLQVTAGSIIRDIPDVESDRRDGVKTLPVVLGFQQTMLALHVLNILSLVAGSLIFPESSFQWMMELTVGWRLLLLLKINRNPNTPLYTNTLNLLTCALIFVLLLIQQLYGLYQPN